MYQHLEWNGFCDNVKSISVECEFKGFSFINNSISQH